MARPTIRGLRTDLDATQGLLRNSFNKQFDYLSEIDDLKARLAGTAVGAGGATDGAIGGAKRLMNEVRENAGSAVNNARGWFNDLGRYRSEYEPTQAFRTTMWNAPLGGHGRALLENMGMPAGQAQVGERIAAGGLSSVVGLTALAAAYDGLFGESQSPGTMPIVVSAGPTQLG